MSSFLLRCSSHSKMTDSTTTTADANVCTATHSNDDENTSTCPTGSNSVVSALQNDTSSSVQVNGVTPDGSGATHLQIDAHCEPGFERVCKSEIIDWASRNTSDIIVSEPESIEIYESHVVFAIQLLRDDFSVLTTLQTLRSCDRIGIIITLRHNVPLATTPIDKRNHDTSTTNSMGLSYLSQVIDTDQSSLLQVCQIYGKVHSRPPIPTFRVKCARDFPILPQHPYETFKEKERKRALSKEIRRLAGPKDIKPVSEPKYHDFTSVAAGQMIGLRLKHKLKWPADLKAPNVTFTADIIGPTFILALSLYMELQERHRTEPISGFVWKTALNSCVAYSLCRLGNFKPGDVVCDPACGIGTIPIEAAVSYPNIMVLGGDLCNQSILQARKNSASLSPSINKRCDWCNWDINVFPCRPESIDCFVSDLPFGRRHGNYSQNAKMYPKLLRFISRALKLRGRAILMTSEMNLMQRCIDDQIPPASLALIEVFYVDIGGILCAVYILQKTEAAPALTVREQMTELEKRQMNSRKKMRTQEPVREGEAIL